MTNRVRQCLSREAGQRPGVAARNHKRLDAQSRVFFDAQSVRTSETADARYVRLNAVSLRRTQDHPSRRTLAETLLPDAKCRSWSMCLMAPYTHQERCSLPCKLAINPATGFLAVFGGNGPAGRGRQETARFPCEHSVLPILRSPARSAPPHYNYGPVLLPMLTARSHLTLH